MKLPLKSCNVCFAGDVLKQKGDLLWTGEGNSIWGNIMKVTVKASLTIHVAELQWMKHENEHEIILFNCQIEHFDQMVCNRQDNHVFLKTFNAVLFRECGKTCLYITSLSTMQLWRTYCKFVLGHRQHSCEVSWPAVQNNPIRVCPIGHTQGQESFHWCPTNQAIVLFSSCITEFMLQWS